MKKLGCESSHTSSLHRQSSWALYITCRDSRLLVWDDAHTSFFAHLPHFTPLWGDFKTSRRNCKLQSHLTCLQDSATESHVIYSVGREEYDSCAVRGPHPRIVAYCTQPYQRKYPHHGKNIFYPNLNIFRCPESSRCRSGRSRRFRTRWSSTPGRTTSSSLGPTSAPATTWRSCSRSSTRTLSGRMWKRSEMTEGKRVDIYKSHSSIITMLTRVSGVSLCSRSPARGTLATCPTCPGSTWLCWSRWRASCCHAPCDVTSRDTWHVTRAMELCS